MPPIGNALRLARLAIFDPRYFAAQAARKLRRTLLLDYRFGRDGKAGRPAAVTFEVTHRCNCRCYMCDLYGTGAEPETVRSGAERPEETLSEDEDRRLMAQLAAHRPVISLTGGEPLLAERGMRLVRLAREFGLAVTITTNGTLLERHAEEIVMAGVDNITVSIDGPRELHDDIRGAARVFDRAAAGLARLHAVKLAAGSSRPHVDINATICGRNHDRLSEIPPVAEALGAERLQFSHLWYWEPRQVEAHNKAFGAVAPCTVQNVLALEGIDVDALVREIGKVRARAGGVPVKFLPEIDGDDVRTYYTEPSAPVKSGRCVAPWLNVRIMPDGEVIPCLDVKVGNVRHASLDDLWNGDAMRRFRRMVQTRKIMPGCTRCCKLFSY